MKGLMVTLLILLSTGIVAGQQSNSNRFDTNGQSAFGSGNFAPQAKLSRPMPDDPEDVTTVRQEAPNRDRTLEIFLGAEDFSKMRNGVGRLPVPLQQYNTEDEPLPLSFIQEVVFGLRDGEVPSAMGKLPETHLIRGEAFKDPDKGQRVLQFALTDRELEWVSDGHLLKFIFQNSDLGKFDRVDFVSKHSVDAANAAEREKERQMANNQPRSFQSTPSPGPFGPGLDDQSQGPVFDPQTRNEFASQFRNNEGSIQDNRPTRQLQKPTPLDAVNLNNARDNRNTSQFGLNRENGFETSMGNRDSRQNSFSNPANQIGRQTQQQISDGELRARRTAEIYQRKAEQQAAANAQLRQDNLARQTRLAELERQLENLSTPNNRQAPPTDRLAQNTGVRSLNNGVLSNQNTGILGSYNDPSSTYRKDQELAELKFENRRLAEDRERLLQEQANERSKQLIADRGENRNQNIQNASFRQPATGVPAARVANRDVQQPTGTPPLRPELVNQGKTSNNVTPTEQSRETRGTLQAMLVLLLGSLALNVLLGMHCRSMYARYEDLADELRETFTSSTSL